MTYTNFIFDLDGPLLDGRQRHYQCYKDILQEFNCQTLDINSYWQMKRERKSRQEQLAATGGEAYYDEFLRLWVERIEEKKYLDLDVLQPDALSVLTSLHKQGRCLILATLRHNAHYLYEQLATLKIRDFFQHVVAVDAQSSADKASGVQAILQDKHGSSLWIGDTEIDSQAANKLSIPVALVSNGLRTEEYLLSLAPQYLGSNLRELESVCNF